MRNFSVVVTVTRVGHKQRPSVSIPLHPTLLFVFPIMFSLTHLIHFPSPASPDFQCLLPPKHPLKPWRLWAVRTLSSEAIWGWGERWALHKTTMTRLSVETWKQWLHTNLCSYSVNRTDRTVWFFICLFKCKVDSTKITSDKVLHPTEWRNHSN